MTDIPRARGTTPLAPLLFFLLAGATPVAIAAQSGGGVVVASATRPAGTPARRDTTPPTPAPTVPPAAAVVVVVPTIPITFSGELRTRSEYERPGGAVATDAFTMMRTRFGARIDVAPGARIVVQMQDSRVLGADPTRAPVAAPTGTYDLHQGYVELAAPVRGVRLAARAGRQEVAFGNERLVGAVGWSNTGRSFDGARLTMTPDGEKPGTERWTASAFAATVEERGRHAIATTPAGDRPRDNTVAGLFVTRALGGDTARKQPPAAMLELTLLRDDGARWRDHDDASRTTVDLRARAPRMLGVLSAELEAAWQSGHQRVLPSEGTTGAAIEQRVRAWLAGARVGTAAMPSRRAAALGVDVLSGDATPNDGRYGAFTTMFATNHPFYGLMDLFADPSARTRDRGLVDALATGALPLGAAVTLRGELHRFSHAVGTTRDIGWEADLLLPVRVSDAATIEVGWSHFRAGTGAAAAGLGDRGATRRWAYLQLRAGF